MALNLTYRQNVFDRSLEWSNCSERWLDCGGLLYATQVQTELESVFFPFNIMFAHPDDHQWTKLEDQVQTLKSWANRLRTPGLAMILKESYEYRTT